jgi:LPPG:FO 2-phospho-L-lactate transferase
MSEEPVRTRVHTQVGALDFQDYFVRQRAEPAVTRVEFAGSARAAMSQAFRAALDTPALQAVIVCPSNPYLSIGPILSLPGVRAALQSRRVPAIAVSPIVAGQALKGPAAKIMRELGKEASSLEVARFYLGLIDAIVIDRADEALAPSLSGLGIRPLVTRIVMATDQDRAELGRQVVEWARSRALANGARSCA